MNIPNPTELGLRVFLVSAVSPVNPAPSPRRIVAKDKRHCWRKFCGLFGHLKPDRSDWTIQEIEIR